MNENNIPVTCEASVITSVSQSSNSNDIIDLTDINDCDECEEIPSFSVIVSNNSVRPQQPGKPARNRRRTNANSPENNPAKARSETLDDSICILYEKLQPAPEIVVVNEVVIDGREQNQEQNQSSDIHSFSIPIPPVVMGSFTVDPAPVTMGSFTVDPAPVTMGSFIEDQVIDFQPIPPLFPEISGERACSPSPAMNYSGDNQIVAPELSSLPSCKYATVINERPCTLLPHMDLQRFPLPTTQRSLDSKPVPHKAPSHGSELEKPNIVIKVPKIQCGICLDGPDEIAASDRKFTSTNCGHVFCDTCIKTSMRNAAKCPKCRKKITSRSIHPLYF